MQQLIKRFLCVAGLCMLGVASARAFSIGGPVGDGGDLWQVPTIGYGAPTITINMAPKNLAEGYRRNIPVVYYAYSPAFLDYFGTAGETNIDETFGMLNNALTNGVSSYSQGLSEVTLDSQQYNYTAQGLQVYDIKSMALSIMLIQLGLAVPEENTWRLHDRILPTGGKCPIDELYTVIQRNFPISASDFDQIDYSPYVNNVLYSYEILEVCTGSPVLADTGIFSVDPLADSFTSVAGGAEGAQTSGGLQGGFNLQAGGFYTGLTSDDIAGFRYLYGTNNIYLETVGGGSLLFNEITNNYPYAPEFQFPVNTNTATGFGTFSLYGLATFALTNPPAAVLANFPGLVIASSGNYFVLATNLVVTPYFAPPPVGSVVGTAPILKFATNYIPYLATNFYTSFANIVTNYYTSNTTAILQTVQVGPKVKAPVGSLPVTNFTSQTVILTNVPSGSYYLVPAFGTNLCGSGIIYTGLTSVIYMTNIMSSTSTNVLTNSLSGFNSYSQNLITWYTNYTYVAYQVNCSQTNDAPELYEGTDKMQFIRVNYDSLLSQTFNPITNGFSKVAITTNYQTRVEHFDRVVAAPDVLIDAADLATGVQDHPVFGTFFYGRSSPNWNDSLILPGGAAANGLAGPGTIDPLIGSPSINIVFNKAGDIYGNGSLAEFGYATNQFLSQFNQYQLIAYGSFDGTTNPPVIYPNGSSIQNLQNTLLLQIAPTGPLYGTNNMASSFQFSVTGGGGAFTPPYTWTSLGPPVGGPPTSGLPPGMTLSSSGLLSGTPTQSGTYDFSLTMTDNYGNTVVWNYTLYIQ